MNQLTELAKAFNSFTEARQIMLSHGVDEIAIFCKRLSDLSLSQEDLNKREGRRDYWRLQQLPENKQVFVDIYSRIAKGKDDQPSALL